MFEMFKRFQRTHKSIHQANLEQLVTDYREIMAEQERLQLQIAKDQSLLTYYQCRAEQIAGLLGTMPVSHWERERRLTDAMAKAQRVDMHTVTPPMAEANQPPTYGRHSQSR